MAPGFILTCRGCGGARIRRIGIIPGAASFAGSALPSILPGSGLYRCPDCRLVFRHPILSKVEYDVLYQAGNSIMWDEDGRRDHALVRAALQAYFTGTSILDVGCSTGRLLMSLAGKYSLFGIEINPGATQLATQRGINVIARDIGDLTALPRVFDAVLSCDVIEHVANPLEFVRLLLTLTAPGGLVILSTGNADAWSWRLSRGRFWYCCIPEHISFVSPAWVARNAKKLDAEVVAVQRFTYSPDYSIAEKATRLLLMTVFVASPVIYSWMRLGRRRNNLPVGRGITRDHFVVVLRKLLPTSASATSAGDAPAVNEPVTDIRASMPADKPSQAAPR
ncbi:MAG TPA: methyltransferase domain-containing protein [Burkholderiales bacterium]|nr:methyltransferase domain-containing protein [Burkholderiales bacterium]